MLRTDQFLFHYKTTQQLLLSFFSAPSARLLFARTHSFAGHSEQVLVPHARMLSAEVLPFLLTAAYVIKINLPQSMVITMA